MKAWQKWAPNAPSTIDSNLVIMRNADGTINLRSSGQSIGTLQELRSELAALNKPPAIVQVTFLGAVKHFGGSWNYPVQRMKGKSDYASRPLVLMTGISRSKGVYVICDAYGGAIAKVASGATVFAHRDRTPYCLQHGSIWTDIGDTQHRLDHSATLSLHAALLFG
jgi:hypothetical protein